MYTSSLTAVGRFKSISKHNHRNQFKTQIHSHQSQILIPMSGVKNSQICTEFEISKLTNTFLMEKSKNELQTVHQEAISIYDIILIISKTKTVSYRTVIHHK
eukprot:215008_1